MPDESTLSETIAEAATKPAEVTIDGQTVKAHPLPDQIEADKYATAKTAAARAGFGLRKAKLVPPGAV